MTTTNLTPTEAHDLVSSTLLRCRVSAENAVHVADALVGAELWGQGGHGLSRIPSYASSSLSGKVDGFAVPVLEHPSPSVIRINAKSGFAYSALRLACDSLSELTSKSGIMMCGITNSHHCGVAGLVVEELASNGLVSLMFSNTPAAMAPWGGSRAVFGTNPIAFGYPVPDRDPVIVDLSLSKVARGKVLGASQKGEKLEEGIGLDSSGSPTTDPNAVLDGGTMVPLGDAKGTALALMVELLSAGLTGSNFAASASSFFDGEGDPPGVGQLIIAIDPFALGGDSNHSLQLFESIESQGARLSGLRRYESRSRIERDGILVDNELLLTIRNLGE